MAEEADILQENSVKTITTETLEQRAVLPPSRFRPRTGSAMADATAVRTHVREVVSEYTVGSLRKAEPGPLVEFRQLVSVDGKPVRTVENAQRTLAQGVRSNDDRVRKKMLEEFASIGLVDIATDYGMILLAFTKRGQQEMKIEPAGEARMGIDDALLLRWRQTSSAAGQLEFRGKQTARRAMEGVLWVRKSDGLPLRIQVWVEHVDGKRTIRDEASVEYAMSFHGFLTPASVVHRHIVDAQTLAENLYRYESFRLFTSDTEIKFTDIPDPPAPKKQ